MWFGVICLAVCGAVPYPNLSTIPEPALTNPIQPSYAAGMVWGVLRMVWGVSMDPASSGISMYRNVYSWRGGIFFFLAGGLYDHLQLDIYRTEKHITI